MVIRALVRARLLGLQLLTLEARVAVGHDQGRPLIAPLIVSPQEPRVLSTGAPRPRPVPARSGSEFAHAIELLQQGTDALERSRRPAETSDRGQLDRGRGPVRAAAGLA